MQLVSVQMTKNRMFPLEVLNIEGHSLVARGTKKMKDSIRWYLHYGHLNIKGLKLLHYKDIVKGLPNINQIEIYEECIYDKQIRHHFPLGEHGEQLLHLSLFIHTYVDPCKLSSSMEEPISYYSQMISLITVGCISLIRLKHKRLTTSKSSRHLWSDRVGTSLKSCTQQGWRVPFQRLPKLL